MIGPERLARLDRIALAMAMVMLGLAILVAGRANIIADSVDYYVNLERLAGRTSTIVRNPHFAAERPPGFPLAATVPYVLLRWVVEPVTGTKRVQGPPPGPPPPAPPAPPANIRPGGRGGPGMPLIPPRPLPLWRVPFKDFPVPREGSWFEWKVVLALAITSYGFLFGGLGAIALALRRLHPELPGYALIVALLITSPMLLFNIVATPLYATLTAFGASALFACFLIRGEAVNRAGNQFVAGVWLGLLVLTRLETGVFAIVFGALLLARGRRALLLRLVAGSSWAIVAWVGYNLRVFGSPAAFHILRGDINVVRFDPGYIAQNLFHPACGVVFWSPLVCLGIAGLLASRRFPLRQVGIASLALLGLFLLRVPVMLEHIGGGPMEIGGLPVGVPTTEAAARAMIRADINRYITVLAPFAVLGLRELAGRLPVWWAARGSVHAA